jgi:hypothetical protein
LSRRDAAAHHNWLLDRRASRNFKLRRRSSYGTIILPMQSGLSLASKHHPPIAINASIIVNQAIYAKPPGGLS